MLFGDSFQSSSATRQFFNFPGRPPPSQSRSHDPSEATPAGLTLRRFRLLRFRSPLLTQSLLLSLPPGTEMVHFPGFALPSLCIQLGVTSYELAGFPHSEISGSRIVCISPELIAAYHVLHRLHAPRHPPCALSSLTIISAHHKKSVSTAGSSRLVLLIPSTVAPPRDTLLRKPCRGQYQSYLNLWDFAYSIVKEHRLLPENRFQTKLQNLSGSQAPRSRPRR
jgi:hypothetical protein